MDSAQATWMTQAGITPGRLILIGVLAVMFAGVLYVQFGASVLGPSAPQSIAQLPGLQSSTAQESKADRADDATMVATDAPRTKKLALDHWQSADLASVIRYDPFALPASFPQPGEAELAGDMAQSEARSALDASAQRAALETARQQSQVELNSLRKQGVEVIIKRGDEYVAIVGGEEVHVGDQVDGFTVIAIDADGVKVAKDLSP